MLSNQTIDGMAVKKREMKYWLESVKTLFASQK